MLALVSILSIGVVGANAQTTCDKTAPVNKTEIFQIDTSNTTATLHFTPPNDIYTKFRIVYGLSEGDERYGVDYVQGNSSGALTYIVNDLSAGTTYYFKIRADNDCAQGTWGAWKTGTTKGGSVVATGSSTITRLPTAGNVFGFMFIGIIALGIISLGFIL